MAASGREDDFVLSIIGNIPSGYHSSDLRRFFSQFIENGGFKCFHFRHRPEGKKEQSSEKEPKTDSGRKTNVNHVNKSNDEKTFCCVVQVAKDRFNDLIKYYHKHFWQNANGDSIPQLCNIQAVTVSETNAEKGKYLSRKERKQISQSRETFTQDDLKSLIELKPPALMPQGNVGTPTMYFMDKIQKCKLPPSIITKLGLVFPKQRCRRIYSSVGFDYGGQVIHCSNHEPEIGMKSAAGKDIIAEDCWLDEAKKEEHDVNEEDMRNEDNADNESGEDIDDCEEWERHEALHDEPRKGERNKERLFEEKIELKWEKGGSGLVFYTDAQYWKQQEGDFDEQTTDDWDVDMSIYYEKDGGDMDARNFAEMRQNQRRRKGEEDITIAGQSFESKIGAFEKHTRGVGRKVMQQQGWVDGKGLGSTYPGMTDALDNDGQAPYNKAGLGYYGEKVDRVGFKRKADPDKVIISSKYSNPEETDPSEPLLRRHMPYHIKHRHSQLTDVHFVKATDRQTFTTN